MPVVPPEQDAFGRALVDHLQGRPAQPLRLQTDDGSTTPAMPPGWFFEPAESWVHWERQALAAVTGPVLDLGAGAGRASLFLEALGHEVTAVDGSPGAIRVCREQGLRDARLEDFLERLPSDRQWRTVLLQCGNIGLAGSWEDTRRLLRQLHDVCAPDAVLIGDTVDPTVGADEHDRKYQRRKVNAGGYVGDVVLRLVYGELAGPWWKQTNVRVADVPRLVAGTGWTLADHFVAGADHYLKLCKTSLGDNP